jgi:hypothetical protein
VNDPRFRGAGAPASARPSRRDVERGVEEGLEILRGAIKELLRRPREERQAHLTLLKLRLASFIPQIESVDRQGPTARRVRAMERVLKALDEVSART